MSVFPLRVGADHPSLAGHFPGRPVVPGVLLLDAVAARLPARIARIVQVKFVAPLLPEQDARIELDLDQAGCRARFRVLRGDTLLASGDLHYAVP
mgnify:CR=1 FL=1